MEQENQKWKSSRGFILALTGAAVGLGNIWRFPYMAGEGGGSAFLLLYLAFVILLGLPLMLSEIGIGKVARNTPLASIGLIAKKSNASSSWKFIAYLGLVTLFFILSFYSVVAGWSLAYFGKVVSGEFLGKSPEQVGQIFGVFTQDWKLLLACHTIFMILTMGVVASGVTKGLERLNNFLMPLLYLILILLVVYAATTDGFSTAMNWLFYPKWENLSWKVTLDAMGHAFFTLALGATALMAYGAYMPERQSLPKAVGFVAFLDVLVALLVGIAIFSIVFTNGLSPSSGPGLMFVTLPIAFGKVDGGSILGAAFFLLLLFATWTSSINLAEPMVATLAKKLKSRLKATIFAGLGVWAFGILSALSFNLLAKFYPLDFVLPEKTIFDIVSSIPSDLFLTIGGLLTGIFAVRVVSKNDMLKVLNNNERFYGVWKFLVTFVATPLLIVVLFMGFKNIFFS